MGPTGAEQVRCMGLGIMGITPAGSRLPCSSKMCKGLLHS